MKNCKTQGIETLADLSKGQVAFQGGSHAEAYVAGVHNLLRNLEEYDMTKDLVVAVIAVSLIFVPWELTPMRRLTVGRL